MEDFIRLGPQGLIMPPLRSAEDVNAVWNAIENGEIATIGTDHAPHQMAASRSKPSPARRSRRCRRSASFRRIGSTARRAPLVLKEVDAVSLLATDMQTFPIIDALERDLGLPVLTSNQALLWASLRALGINSPLNGIGGLLRGQGRV
jgi:hypothetical protein